MCVRETLALFPQVRASQGSRQASLCSDGSVLDLLCPIREAQVTHGAAEHLKRGWCDRGTFHFASLCFAYV